MRFKSFGILLLPILALNAFEVSAQSFETIFYMGGNGAGQLEAVRTHAREISILAPQAYYVTADGVLHGAVSDSVLQLAAESGIRMMPLVHNRGFDQETIHNLLEDEVAQRRSIDSMVVLAGRYGYWGWQFDYENIHVSDRDALSDYYATTASALHAAGLVLSIAVVPSDGSKGASPFAGYMQDNWRNSFDMAALADAGDFISLMTYAQHGGVTTPGPIAGLPWMREMLVYALSVGVPAEKISLGIPSYSGYWFPDYSEEKGARVVGREISFDKAQDLLTTSGATLQWLSEQGVSYAFWQNEVTFEWLFLEDVRSLKAKLELYDAYPALRGISVWVLGAEDPATWDVMELRKPER